MHQRRKSISVLRKDVTAKPSSGDVTRKRKLQKHNEGKKRMRQFGKSPGSIYSGAEDGDN